MMPMGDVWRMWVAALLMFMVVMAVFAGLNSCAFGHDYKRPDLDGWYGSLRNPHSDSSVVKSLGCCSKEDCHETEADLRGPDWWARLGTRRGRDWELGEWVQVPVEAVLLNQSNPTGNAVICHSMSIGPGPNGRVTKDHNTVFCFIPPTES